MVDTAWVNPMEGIMDKVTKSHLGIMISLLAFVCGLLGFFVVDFYTSTKTFQKEMSSYILESNGKLGAIQNDITAIQKDVDWLKTK